MISVLTPHLGNITEMETYRRNLNLLRNDNRITEWLVDHSEGIAKARDSLLRKAKNNLLFWLDADVELVNNPIDIFLRILERDKNNAGVGAIPLWWGNDWKIVIEKALETLEQKNLPEEYDAWYRPFECSLFKKEPLIEINGFDKSFALTGEDCDVLYRLNENNYKVIMTKKVKVYHHFNQKEYWNKMKNYKLGMMNVLKKHGKYISRPTSDLNLLEKLLRRIQISYILLKMKKPHCILLIPIFMCKSVMLYRSIIGTNEFRVFF